MVHNSEEVKGIYEKFIFPISASPQTQSLLPFCYALFQRCFVHKKPVYTYMHTYVYTCAYTGHKYIFMRIYVCIHSTSIWELFFFLINWLRRKIEHHSLTIN